jgi:hypothetical protein
MGFAVAVAFLLSLTGCATGQNGGLVGLGHTITTTTADGSVTVEQIPPTPEEIQAYVNTAIQIAQQIVALYEQFDDDDETGPSAEDQMKLQLQLASLQVLNNWIVQNGGTAIDWQAILAEKKGTQNQ